MSKLSDYFGQSIGIPIENAIKSRLGFMENMYDVCLIPTRGDGKCFFNALVLAENRIYNRNVSELEFISKVKKLINECTTNIYCDSKHKNYIFNGPCPNVELIGAACASLQNKRIIIFSDDIDFEKGGLISYFEPCLKYNEESDVVFMICNQGHFSLIEFKPKSSKLSNFDIRNLLFSHFIFNEY